MKNDSVPTPAKKKHANKISHRDGEGKFKEPPPAQPTTVPTTKKSTNDKTVRTPPKRSEKK